MVVYHSEIKLKRTKEIDIVNITPDLENLISRSKITDGLVTVFVAGSTGAIITLEYEPGLIQDIPALLERVASKSIKYLHDQTWHDGNGHSHVRASLLGPSLTIPVREKRLIHGTWQQVAFIELDNKPRNRTLFVTIIGE